MHQIPFYFLSLWKASVLVEMPFVDPGLDGYNHRDLGLNPYGILISNDKICILPCCNKYMTVSNTVLYVEISLNRQNEHPFFTSQYYVVIFQLYIYPTNYSKKNRGNSKLYPPCNYRKLPTLCHDVDFACLRSFHKMEKSI